MTDFTTVAGAFEQAGLYYVSNKNGTVEAKEKVTYCQQLGSTPAEEINILAAYFILTELETKLAEVADSLPSKTKPEMEISGNVRRGKLMAALDAVSPENEAARRKIIALINSLDPDYFNRIELPADKIKELKKPLFNGQGIKGCLDHIIKTEKDSGLSSQLLSPQTKNKLAAVYKQNGDLKATLKLLLGGIAEAQNPTGPCVPKINVVKPNRIVQDSKVTIVITGENLQMAGFVAGIEQVLGSNNGPVMTELAEALIIDGRNQMPNSVAEDGKSLKFDIQEVGANPGHYTLRLYDQDSKDFTKPVTFNLEVVSKKAFQKKNGIKPSTKPLTDWQDLARRFSRSLDPRFTLYIGLGPQFDANATQYLNNTPYEQLSRLYQQTPYLTLGLGLGENRRGYDILNKALSLTPDVDLALTLYSSGEDTKDIMANLTLELGGNVRWQPTKYANPFFSADYNLESNWNPYSTPGNPQALTHSVPLKLGLISQPLEWLGFSASFGLTLQQIDYDQEKLGYAIKTSGLYPQARLKLVLGSPQLMAGARGPMLTYQHTEVFAGSRGLPNGQDLQTNEPLEFKKDLSGRDIDVKLTLPTMWRFKGTSLQYIHGSRSLADWLTTTSHQVGGSTSLVVNKQVNWWIFDFTVQDISAGYSYRYQPQLDHFYPLNQQSHQANVGLGLLVGPTRLDLGFDIKHILLRDSQLLNNYQNYPNSSPLPWGFDTTAFGLTLDVSLPE